MKAIIDQQIDWGIDHPVCYGLLVEGKHSLQHEFCQKTHCKLLGYGCYLYKKSIQYEAEYRSILIAQFRTFARCPGHYAPTTCHQCSDTS